MIARTLAAIGIPAAILLSGFYAFAEPGAAVPFPSNYREWTHVKTIFVGPQSKNFERRGGFHHYYANREAVEGYRTHKFPDGAVIVDEGVYTKEEGGVILEGARRTLDVMRKDSRRYAETGGWGFDQFAGDNRTDGAAAAVRDACFSCHAKAQDRDFVYSEIRK
jgi:hypothetical protein